MFILSLLVLNNLATLHAASGVIWSKKEQDFVPLFSIPTFLAAKNIYLQKFRDLERHNFRKAVLTISYYEETNLVSFINNDTQITGVCGDFWNILADYLNFTLIPIKLEDKNFGMKHENGSYDGILGLIQQNKSQIIPRSGIFTYRLSLVEYTIPLWTVRYHLYIKPEWKHDEVWWIHLFTLQLWYSFFLVLLIMSLAGYLSEKLSVHSAKEAIRYNLNDQIFYTFAIASSQGCVPANLHNKSRIIYLCTSMFSWLVFIAFSSHAIFLMMNKRSVLPFSGLKSLIQDSKYDAVAFSGSMVHEEFEDKVAKYIKHVHDYSRISYESSAEELYRKVCFAEKKKLAAFEAEDRHQAIGRNICRLVPTKASYFETWIASAIKRGFKYKRSFDYGMLKMFETGLLDGLKDRWLYIKLNDNEEVPFQSIDMSQVYLIFGILCIGFVMSIVLLFVEHLTFFWCSAAMEKDQKKKVLVKLKDLKMINNQKFYYIKY